MAVNLKSLGLSIDNMVKLGFSASTAVGLFGEASVKELVVETFGGNYPASSGTGADAFNFAVQADSAIKASGGNVSYLDYLSGVESQLNANGYSINDLNYSIDANGNVTASIDGGGTTTLNINDLLAQAIDTAFPAA